MIEKVFPHQCLADAPVPVHIRSAHCESSAVHEHHHSETWKVIFDLWSFRQMMAKGHVYLSFANCRSLFLVYDPHLISELGPSVLFQPDF